MAREGSKTPMQLYYTSRQNIWWLELVNANISDEERSNDTNHQYVKKNDGYCIKCGHYPEVSYIRELDCECDCHE